MICQCRQEHDANAHKPSSCTETFHNNFLFFFIQFAVALSFAWPSGNEKRFTGATTKKINVKRNIVLRAKTKEV